MSKKHKNRVHDAAGDRTMYTVIHVVMVILLIVTLYPLIYVVSSSFSSAEAVSTGKVVLWPVDFSLRGYQQVFKYQAICLGYKNTIFYTLVGTAINVVLTVCAAFALSKKTLPGRSLFTFLFTFTMLFSGGIIPTYSPHVADASRQSCRGVFFSAAVRGLATDLTERERSGTMTMELYTVFRGARV